MCYYGNAKNALTCYQILIPGKQDDYAVHAKGWYQKMHDNICQSCGENIPHSAEHANSCLSKLSKIVRSMLK